MRRFLSVGSSILLLTIFPVAVLAVIFLLPTGDTGNHFGIQRSLQSFALTGDMKKGLLAPQVDSLRSAAILVRKNTDLRMALAADDRESIERIANGLWEKISENVNLVMIWRDSGANQQGIFFSEKVSGRRFNGDFSAIEPGANQERVPEVFFERFQDGIIRLVHLTSFTDGRTPARYWLAVGIDQNVLLSLIREKRAFSSVRLVPAGMSLGAASNILGGTDSFSVVSLRNGRGDAIGHLVVGAGRGQSRNLFVGRAGNLFLAATLVVLASLFFSFVFVHRLRKRLKSLKALAAVVAWGKCSPKAIVRNPDELDRIAAALYGDAANRNDEKKISYDPTLFIHPAI